MEGREWHEGEGEELDCTLRLMGDEMQSFLATKQTKLRCTRLAGWCCWWWRKSCDEQCGVFEYVGVKMLQPCQKSASEECMWGQLWQGLQARGRGVLKVR